VTTPRIDELRRRLQEIQEERRLFYERTQKEIEEAKHELSLHLNREALRQATEMGWKVGDVVQISRLGGPVQPAVITEFTYTLNVHSDQYVARVEWSNPNGPKKPPSELKAKIKLENLTRYAE
jgi:hypothetical protein